MAPKRKSLLDQPTHDAVARIVGNYLDAAARGLARLEESTNPKGLHAFRVAIRRLRSLLRAYRPWMGRVAGRKVRRRLRDLTRSTNTTRDADVEIEWLSSQADHLARDERAGFSWLLRRVRSRKSRGYSTASRKLGRDLAGVARLVRSRLQDAEGPEQRPFRSTFLDLLEPAVTELRESLAAISGADDEANIHKSRIRVKRLRYLIEPLGKEFAEARALVKPLKQQQTLLGALHDTQVLEEEIAQEIEEAATEKARRLHRLALDGAVNSLARERRRDESLGLLVLASRTREQRDRLYAEFARKWLANRRFELRTEVGALRALKNAGNASGSPTV